MNHNTCNVPTLLLGLDLGTDVQFPLVVPAEQKRKFNICTPYFFCNFTAVIYLFFTVNTKQKHCKRLTNYSKKHYKTQSLQTNFHVCYLDYNHKNSQLT